MTYRMIPFQYFNAAMNMGIDEAIMEGLRAHTSPPTVRFYGWSPSAVSIGYFQGLHQEVNLEACHLAGGEVVRRLTGGGAVYHDETGEVTYSIIGPQEDFPGDILESYRAICADVMAAIEMLGLQPVFSPVNDILVDGRKVSGNAQTRRGGVLLQHGTILYTVDVEKMFGLLTVSEEKVSDKLVRSVKKRVTCISEFLPVSLGGVAEALQEGFSRSRPAAPGDYAPQELERAAELAKTKYSTREWVAAR
jgi:lipoyltransferase/lipoate-protein ligase